MSAHIQIFYKGTSGNWEAELESYSVADFSGVCPGVGDFLISPGATKRQGEDRPDFKDPTRRTVYEVAARYFKPTTDHLGKETLHIALCCETRAATDGEINIL